ncbi:MAG: hypothetical protein NC350_00360 [Corallococcus sp.]|nr:hypothetical protein [Corallococcus sp.]
MQLALFINKLGTADIIFFIACAVVVVAIVGIYFLIPVINKKQYGEQRKNWEKREQALKSNKSELQTATEETPLENQEDTSDSQEAALEGQETAPSVLQENAAIQTADDADIPATKEE